MISHSIHYKREPTKLPLCIIAVSQNIINYNLFICFSSIFDIKLFIYFASKFNIKPVK